MSREPLCLLHCHYRTIGGHPVRLYNERSVEAIAWDRYGGPCGLWKWLKRLLSHHIDKHGDARSFAIPHNYQAGRKYDLTLPRQPPVPPAYDPYVGRSRRLQQAKARLLNWLRLACNAALDRAAPHDAQPGLGGGNWQPVLSDTRKAAMQRAVRFARGYPPRDQTCYPSSPWIMCLRNVLQSAPKLPSRRTAWGIRVDGLEFFEAPSCRRGHGHYEWSGAYIERVLKASRTVFAAHGDGQTVRHGVLWDIYHAVRVPRAGRLASLLLRRTLRVSSIWDRSAVGYAMIPSRRRGRTPQRHG
ncbi:hypothetical protein LXA43DRAFT_957910 [Ganoderma leucocontextum]|nr:hypothetical protein LXA43DRAFT_957910 [Ganoderma leucocontextum]